MKDLIQKEKIKVLFVEDDKLFNQSLTRRLEKRNLEVSSVLNAENALEYLKNNAYDVIVSDIKMDEMDGIEFLSHVRKVDEHLPVILLTGFGSLDSAQKAVRLNAFDYLFKPLDDIDDLLIPIRNAAKTYNIHRTIINLKNYYRMILELIPSGIASFDQHKCIEDINKAFGEMFKLFDPKVIGQSSEAVFDDFISEQVANLRQNKESRFEYIIDGKVCSFLLKNFELDRELKTLLLVSEINIANLSEREKQIIYKILQNHSRAEIARDLGIDVRSVYTYIKRIKIKLAGKINLSLWRDGNR